MFSIILNLVIFLIYSLVWSQLKRLPLFWSKERQSRLFRFLILTTKTTTIHLLMSEPFMDESRGNLYFIEVNDQSSSDLSVYEMERNGSSWSLKYHVDLEPVAAAFPEMIITEYYTYRWIYAFSVIGFVKEEIDAESYIVLHIPNKAVKYNFINKTFKKLCSFEPSQDDGVNNFYGSRRSFKFIESLANF